MKIDVASARKCLKSFDFKTLFREHLGWDNHQAQLDISVDGGVVRLAAVAQKRGFVAFVCQSAIPDRAARLKIDHQVTKSVREHFIIYADQPSGRQVWQWVRREPGKPLASRDHRFDASQSGDPLIQRLNQIAVSLDEEEKITVVDVTGRAKAAFDVDKVTKKFYDRFKAEHTAFLHLIKGIKSNEDLQWYTSLMLNRLMFVYFIQKKGFLDDDLDYLRHRLVMVRESKGKDKFHSFYRYFLLRLFHDGLGKSPGERKLDPAMEKLLGKVPFLNGGFFELHPLEERNPALDIPDKAFEKLFDFFDQYSWHLEERPLRADNEINPDVVGYIFEKYINQKQMGAYYTKEDITEYISKNTIIPFLFDAARKKCAIAFQPDSALWRLLRDTPDRYLYPAVRHGVIAEDGSIVPESALPDFVQRGMQDPKVRMHDKRYNLEQAPAKDPVRLATETWREYVCRRNRCLDLRERLRGGEIHEINDLITLNLDIWQFARDAIVNAEGSELLRAFWRAIEKITVLDPTCGSGAFLFAALRILETLYSDCLARMALFLDDIVGKKHHPEQFSDFKKVLAQIARHPSERYFILKSIIINNLFGVDIMEEAIEICKLRLFLKLVAQVERVEQIEPLPDIDFNIRAGNTLVGFASLEQVEKSMESDWERLQSLPRIEEDAELVDHAFAQFRDQQTAHGGKVTPKDKQELRTRLAKLDDELDRYLAGEYGVDVEKQKDFDAWKASHQPFHWFVEFYGIMHAGGFDVIIGNPPYVELSDVADQYSIRGLQLLDTGNLYALCVERFSSLFGGGGRCGVIVPISFVSTPRMFPLMRLAHAVFSSMHLSHFAVRPGKLFVGVDMNLTILLGKAGFQEHSHIIWSTGYNRWKEEFRGTLFQILTYALTGVCEDLQCIPKIGTATEARLFSLLRTQTPLSKIATTLSGDELYYHSGGRYFRKCLKQGLSNEYKRLVVPRGMGSAVLCLMTSSLYYWFWVVISDCYHVTKRDVNGLPVSTTATKDCVFERLAGVLLEDLEANASKRIRSRANGEEQVEVNFHVGRSKGILDKIDAVLAHHYGMHSEHTDMIINYDAKYRGSGDDE